MSRPTRTPSLVRRGGATVLASAVLVIATGAWAEAHVQAIPDQTAAGTEITKITFRVPTESETAGTVKVTVSLPTSTPLLEVLAEPVAGWTSAVTEGNLPKAVTVEGTTITKAPVTVTWTANKGQEVAPGEFQEFAISAGPIPDTKELDFPVAQAYSDGKVVNWNQPQAAGADEPEYPLPHFAVTAAVPDDDAVAATTAPATGTDAVAPVGSSSKTTDSLARWLGIGGIVIGLLGFGAALLGWRRRPVAS